MVRNELFFKDIVAQLFHLQIAIVPVPQVVYRPRVDDQASSQQNTFLPKWAFTDLHAQVTRYHLKNHRAAYFSFARY